MVIDSMSYNLYWGDMHTQFLPHSPSENWTAFVEQSFQSARDYLDFYPIAFYPAFHVKTSPDTHAETRGWRDEFQSDSCEEGGRAVGGLVLLPKPG